MQKGKDKELDFKKQQKLKQQAQAKKAAVKESEAAETSAIQTAKAAKGMRTAGDVMKRLNWDESLDPQHFTLGYLDRFLGLQETTYDVFCEQEEFADVPEHRIQYFKYLGVKVWDKESMLDNFFGSSKNSTRTINDYVEAALNYQAEQAAAAAAAPADALPAAVVVAETAEEAEAKRLAQLRRDIAARRAEIAASKAAGASAGAGGAQADSKRAGSPSGDGKRQSPDLFSNLSERRADTVPAGSAGSASASPARGSRTLRSGSGSGAGGGGGITVVFAGSASAASSSAAAGSASAASGTRSQGFAAEASAWSSS